MKRTTIMAEEDLLDRLREVAASEGRSLGDIVREALEEKVTALAPAPKSLGHGDSRGRAPRAAKIGDLDIEPDSWRSS